MQTRIVAWSFGIVGALLVVLNAFHLSVGFARVRRALESQPIPERFADALKTAWLYLGTMGVVLGVLLCWLAADAAAGSPVAWKAGVAIGVGLVAVGVASFFATGRHPGFLVLSVFGLAVLVPLLVYRAYFRN